MFERMNDEEVEAMFEIEADQARVRRRLKEGVIWIRGDAGDPELVRLLGSSGNGVGKSVSLPYVACGCGKVPAERCAVGQAWRISFCLED